MSRTRTKGKSYWFPVFLCALIILNTTLIFWGLQKLENYLAEFEAGTPESALTSFIDELDSGNYAAVLYATGFSESRFVKNEQGMEYLQGIFDAARGNIGWTKKSGNEGEYYIFDKNSNNRLTTLSLTQKEDGGWSFAIPYPAELAFEISAPEGVKVILNMEELEAGDLQGEAEILESFLGVKADIELPKTIRYKAEGLLTEPHIEATAYDGVECAVESDGEGKYRVELPEAQDGEQEQFKALMQKAAMLYANFISEDASFNQLAAVLYPKSEFYASVGTFYNGWYVNHDANEFRDIEFSEVIKLSENAFSGKIAFTYVVKVGAREFPYPSEYRLSFIQSGGEWKCVNIETL